MDATSTIIAGKIESIFENGLSVLRIGSSLFNLDIEGESYPIGTYVEVNSQSLILYDINL
jgi:hypothetical protein